MLLLSFDEVIVVLYSGIARDRMKIIGVHNKMVNIPALSKCE